MFLFATLIFVGLTGVITVEYHLEVNGQAADTEHMFFLRCVCVLCEENYDECVYKCVCVCTLLCPVCME